MIIAEGGCDSRTGESNLADESVCDVMEWEANARSLIMNSANWVRYH